MCGGSNIRELYIKKNFSILKCAHCGLTFTDIPENLNLLDIYDESYFQGGKEDGYSNYVASERVLKNEFRKSVTLLRDLTKKRGGLRLLEIGSAYGFFLDEAARSFTCTGIEVSKEGVDFSRKRGHHVILGIADEETMKQQGNFDVIVMFDVIEHLPFPVETVCLLAKHLNKDGIVLIVTGDIQSPLARLFGKFWRLMTPPQHTFFFSRRTLKTLLEKAGLSIVKTDRPWKVVPVGLALYQLTARLGLKLRWLEKFNRFGLPVNLFDAVRIIGRKS